MTDLRNIIFGITAFTFGIIFFMFMFIAYYQIGDTYILTTLDNTTTTMGASMGLNSNMLTYIHSLPVTYRALNIPFDLIFLAFLIMGIVASMYAAIRVQEEGWWSFFGTLTLGMLVILLISSYVAIIKSWLVLNLFDNFLGVSVQTMPLFYWWVNNMGIFNFVWAILLIIVNKINFTYIRDYDTENQDVISTGGYEK
jgi:hypothetical protein